MSTTLYETLTFHDAVDHTLDKVMGGDSSPRSRRQAYEAVLYAYHELPARRRWRYYWRPFTIQTVARYNTGTIAYDYTGGTYERMVTLTGGTFPADADTYAMNIAGARYGIEAYKSSTVVTLRETDCPTADIASGTAYAIVKDTYPLPSNLRSIDYLYDVFAPGRMLPQVVPDDIMRERRLVRTSAVPLMYAVYRDERYAGSEALHFAPSCTSVRTYQGYAQYWPLELKILDYSGNGTVATTNGSTTVTGTSTTFTTAMEGAVIRFSATGDTKIPTSLVGEVDKNRLNPYTMQRIVRTVTNSTSLELEQAADTTLSGSGYRISSRIDIEPGAMRNAFLRGCEAFFSPQDRKGRQERLAEYERALAHAMYADQRAIESPGVSFIPHTLADVAASINNSTGGASAAGAV